MKQPKKLTRRQKEILSKNGLNPDDYGFKAETDFYYKFIVKRTGAIKSISKF